MFSTPLLKAASALALAGSLASAAGAVHDNAVDECIVFDSSFDAQSPNEAPPSSVHQVVPAITPTPALTESGAPWTNVSRTVDSAASDDVRTVYTTSVATLAGCPPGAGPCAGNSYTTTIIKVLYTTRCSGQQCSLPTDAASPERPAVACAGTSCSGVELSAQGRIVQSNDDAGGIKALHEGDADSQDATRNGRKSKVQFGIEGSGGISGDATAEVASEVDDKTKGHSNSNAQAVSVALVPSGSVKPTNNDQRTEVSKPNHPVFKVNNSTARIAQSSHKPYEVIEKHNSTINDQPAATKSTVNIKPSTTAPSFDKTRENNTCVGSNCAVYPVNSTTVTSATATTSTMTFPIANSSTSVMTSTNVPATIPATATEVPLNVQKFYDNIVARGQCSHVLAGGFHSSDKDYGDFTYCGDYRASSNVIFIQGRNGDLANMDIDCDGAPGGPADDGRCESSTDTQYQTSFKHVIQSYNAGIDDLDAKVHPFVVFGNESEEKKPGWPTFEPREYGIEPLSVMAVVCNGKLIFGVWGDTNGDDGDEAMVGETSISLATACYGNVVNGNYGHSENDVLYLAFPGKDAVPGADGAKWSASNFAEFHESIAGLGKKLIQRIKGDAQPDANYPSRYRRPEVSKPTEPPVAKTCSWEGHCEGATCKDENDCSDDLVCRSGKCAPLRAGR